MRISKKRRRKKIKKLPFRKTCNIISDSKGKNWNRHLILRTDCKLRRKSRHSSVKATRMIANISRRWIHICRKSAWKSNIEIPRFSIHLFSCFEVRRRSEEDTRHLLQVFAVSSKPLLILAIPLPFEVRRPIPIRKVQFRWDTFRTSQRPFLLWCLLPYKTVLLLSLSDFVAEDQERSRHFCWKQPKDHLIAILGSV